MNSLTLEKIDYIVSKAAIAFDRYQEAEGDFNHTVSGDIDIENTPNMRRMSRSPLAFLNKTRLEPDAVFRDLLDPEVVSESEIEIAVTLFNQLMTHNQSDFQEALRNELEKESGEEIYVQLR